MKDLMLVERGKDVGFQRYRRISGYLVPDIKRWNNAKAQELRDRTINLSLKQG